MSAVTDQVEYDAIAEDYRASKQWGFREVIEGHTLQLLWGDVRHRAVLDLACGEGFHTRRLKQAGAQVVLGVDLSGEMIELAEAEERRRPLGCRYRRADAAELAFGGTFDLVSAAYLLNYARTEEELQRFCTVAFRALRPGGRFVGFNDNVHRDPNLAPSFWRYGFEKRCRLNPREGDEITYTLRRPEGGSFSITNFYLSPNTYARAFALAGFEDFAWEGPFLAPEEQSNPFWRSFLQHAPLIGFSARKPELRPAVVC